MNADVGAFKKLTYRRVGGCRQKVGIFVGKGTRKGRSDVMKKNEEKDEGMILIVGLLRGRLMRMRESFIPRRYGRNFL
jgi:hypothetical protein